MSKFQNYGLATGLISVFLCACAPAVVEDTLVGYVETEWVYISAPESGWIVSKPVANTDRLKIFTKTFIEHSISSRDLNLLTQTQFGRSCTRPHTTMPLISKFKGRY